METPQFVLLSLGILSLDTLELPGKIFDRAPSARKLLPREMAQLVPLSP